MISIPFCSHGFLKIAPMSFRIVPKIACLRYLGANTTWYLQFHLLCAKLCVSNWMTSSALNRLANQIYFSKGGFLFLLKAKAFFLTCRAGGFRSIAVEIYKSEICDFLAQVRRQFALQIGRANGRTYLLVDDHGYEL